MRAIALAGRASALEAGQSSMADAGPIVITGLTPKQAIDGPMFEQPEWTRAYVRNLGHAPAANPNASLRISVPVA